MKVDLNQFILEHSGQLILVSPFIKEAALRRAVDGIDDSVPITIYTRWVPAEVAAGVSDLSVYDWAVERGNVDVFLLRELHAKTYVRGDRALVGSGNMTGQGLGWGPAPNLEILVEVAAKRPEVQALLTELQDQSTPATSAIQRAIHDAAERIGPEVPLSYLLAGPGLPQQKELASAPVWLPRTSEPRRLYDAYSPEGGFSLLQSTVEDAEHDLAVLQVPSGYDRQGFVGHVRAVLMQSSVFSVIDAALQEGEEPRQALVRKLELDRPIVDDAWNTLADWLMYFFRDRYRVEAPRDAFRIVKSKAVE